ncbi:hypothetical protein WJ47_34445 [Burkholderia ubonensis]|uniref:Uncharacterized protein n=1 Tax=Burkholderia ubonensis TaxID=101571 RepID=A0AB73FU29_9BURK|nr:hypothetical protein [Burkholderia ubonensis]KVK74443.1 hypothetical protein WJ44_17715 [Burkholderia ubonensis]KVL75500.1 hypothetical protein WJ47_34445 [Burkholderia ubonensis]KVM21119.1 hypothetical protein WJ53_00250 [Burkholderia ubonensis]KVM29936.1 hypothetical protein WJ54_11490 [Burkholderia ubonensis]
MEATVHLTLAAGFLAIGHLDKLRDYREGLKSAKGLPDDLPVLTCPVAEEDAHRFSAPNFETCFGFGTTVKTLGVPLMTIRLQVGGAQIYWLADLTDPEVWSAYDMWKRVGCAPIALLLESGNNRSCKFGVQDVSGKPTSMEDFRVYAGKPVSEDIWQTMEFLSKSGLMKMQATTDIPGVPLTQVLVNILLTKRLERYAIGPKYVTKPNIIVPPYSAGRVG